MGSVEEGVELSHDIYLAQAEAYKAEGSPNNNNLNGDEEIAENSANNVGRSSGRMGTALFACMIVLLLSAGVITAALMVTVRKQSANENVHSR